MSNVQPIGPMLRKVPVGQVRAASTLSPAFINLNKTRYPRLEQFISRASSEVWDAVESFVNALNPSRSVSAEKVREFFGVVEIECGRVPNSAELSTEVMMGADATGARQKYLNKLVTFIQENRNNAPVLATLARQALPLHALQVMVSAARNYLSPQGCDLVLSNVAKQISPMVLAHESGAGYRELFQDLRREGEYLAMHDVMAQKTAEVMNVSLPKKGSAAGRWLDENISFYARSPRPFALAQAVRLTRDPNLIEEASLRVNEIAKTHPGESKKIATAIFVNPASPPEALEHVKGYVSEQVKAARKAQEQDAQHAHRPSAHHVI